MSQPKSIKLSHFTCSKCPFFYLYWREQCSSRTSFFASASNIDDIQYRVIALKIKNVEDEEKQTFLPCHSLFAKMFPPDKLNIQRKTFPFFLVSQTFHWYNQKNWVSGEKKEKVFYGQHVFMLFHVFSS